MAAYGCSDEDLTVAMKKKVELASWGSWPTSYDRRGLI